MSRIRQMPIHLRPISDLQSGCFLWIFVLFLLHGLTYASQGHCIFNLVFVLINKARQTSLHTHIFKWRSRCKHIWGSIMRLYWQPANSIRNYFLIKKASVLNYELSCNTKPCTSMNQLVCDLPNHLHVNCNFRNGTHSLTTQYKQTAEYIYLQMAALVYKPASGLFIHQSSCNYRAPLRKPSSSPEFQRSPSDRP